MVWDLGDIFALCADGGRNDAYHAYSHVNTLGGTAEAFLAKGERRYLRKLVNEADHFTRERD
jgi:hypothetical protein